LLAETYGLGADPYNGDCVLFVKRDRTQLRAVVGDGVGLYPEALSRKDPPVLSRSSPPAAWAAAD
jgi:hypothetical protein